MAVERTYVDHQTRYALRQGAALSGALIWRARPDEPGRWEIVLPGPGGREDVYGTSHERDATHLEGWLREFIDKEGAAELAAAVDAAPPPTAGWRSGPPAD